MNQEIEKFPVIEVESAPERRLRLFTKKRAALGLTAILLVQNIDAIDMAYSYTFSGGSMNPDVPGCEYTPPETTIPPTTNPANETSDTDSATTSTLPPPTTTNPTEEEEKKAENEQSSAKNNSWIQVIKNAPEFFFGQKNSMYDHLEDSSVSEYSGIEFEIYNTGEEPERTIDIDSLDELFHFSLTTDIDHANPEIEHLMDCVSRKVLEEKVLQGKTEKIVIPSTQDYCISNWILKRVSDSENNDCTQTGAGLPKIELEFLNFKPFSEEYFILTAGDINAESKEDLNKRLNKMFLHESIHRIFYMLGVTPREDQDEQIVKYL